MAVDHGVTVVVPIAHDLARKNGRIVCGPGTKLACDHAIEIARGTPNAIILVSATKARKFDNVVMAQVMGAYMAEAAPDVVIRSREADRFKTLGEILSVALYVKGLRDTFGTDNVREVVFAVKDWHAERVRALAAAVFSAHRFDNVNFRIREHQAPGAWWEKKLEPWKTERDLRFFYDNLYHDIAGIPR